MSNEPQFENVAEVLKARFGDVAPEIDVDTSGVVHSARRRRVARVSVGAGMAAALALMPIAIFLGGSPGDGARGGPVAAAPEASNSAPVVRAVEVLTYSPGSPVRLALMMGTLTVSDNNCLALTPQGTDILVVVLPEGWHTTSDASGAVVLHDPTGERVAGEGDWVAGGGGLVSSGADHSWQNHPCTVNDLAVVSDLHLARDPDSSY